MGELLKFDFSKVQEKPLKRIVSCLVMDEAQRIALIRRYSPKQLEQMRASLGEHDMPYTDPRFAGHIHYTLPGGEKNRGENCIEAIVRELHEELGIEAKPDMFLHLWAQEFAPTHKFYKNGAVQDVFMISTKGYTGTPHNTEKAEREEGHIEVTFECWDEIKQKLGAKLTPETIYIFENLMEVTEYESANNNFIIS